MFSIIFAALDYIDIYFLINIEEVENEDFECLV